MRCHGDDLTDVDLDRVVGEQHRVGDGTLIRRGHDATLPTPNEVKSALRGLADSPLRAQADEDLLERVTRKLPRVVARRHSAQRPQNFARGHVPLVRCVNDDHGVDARAQVDAATDRLQEGRNIREIPGISSSAHVPDDVEPVHSRDAVNRFCA